MLLDLRSKQHYDSTRTGPIQQILSTKWMWKLIPSNITLHDCFDRRIYIPHCPVVPSVDKNMYVNISDECDFTRDSLGVTMYHHTFPWAQPAFLPGGKG